MTRCLRLGIALAALTGAAGCSSAADTEACPGPGAIASIRSDASAPREDCSSTSYERVTPNGGVSYVSEAFLASVPLAASGTPGADQFKLDLYLPKAGAKPFSTVIWIHAGGWQNGSKDDVANGLFVLCHGYALASVEYRLTSYGSGSRRGDAVGSPDRPQTHPEQIQDIKAAIRFLRAQASAYGLDPDRFAAFGGSSGGHLAALAGAGAGSPELEDLSQGNAGESSAVRAVVAWSTPTWFATMDAELAAGAACGGGHGESTSAESKLIGCPLATATDGSSASCVAKMKAASPIPYVEASAPPFLLIHGQEDCVAPVQQSRRLYDALTGAGVCATLRNAIGVGHTDDPFWKTGPPRRLAIDFLDEALR